MNRRAVDVTYASLTSATHHLLYTVQGNICVYRTVSLCWNVARASHHPAPVLMTPIRLLNSAWEKAKPCRYARLQHPPASFPPRLPHAGLNCIPSLPIRSTLYRVPTLSWLWSIPRVEDGRGSGEFLRKMCCENTSANIMERKHRSWQLITGDRREKGNFRKRIIIVLLLLTPQSIHRRR